MKQVKKKQHYVWQYYMQSWADGKRVKVFDITKDYRFMTHTEGICQERYFYKGNNLSKAAFDNLKEFLTNFVKKTEKIEDFYAVLSDVDFHIIELTILLDLKERILAKKEFKLRDIVIKENAAQFYTEKNMGPLIIELIKEKTLWSLMLKEKSIVDSHEQIDASLNKGIKSLYCFIKHLNDNDCSESNFMYELDDYVKTINLDILENLYSQYEQFSIEAIDELRDRKTGFFTNPQKKLDFINFVSMQLGRTKKTIGSFQEKVIPSMDNLGRKLKANEESFVNNLSDLAPYLYFFQSKLLAPLLDSLLNTLVVNYSDGSVDFITSDQPVVPIKSSEGLKQFMIYYPVSPNISIILKHTETKEPKVEEDILTEKEINKWNNLVHNECKTYVILNNC